MKTLIIRHVPSKSGSPQFEVAREDHTFADPVGVTSPFGYKVADSPDDLMKNLQWYLEDFLEYPFEPNTTRADNILAALDSWGKDAFNSLFHGGEPALWIHDIKKTGYDKLRLVISSDDAGVLYWPWEALFDPKASYLSTQCQIERRLNHVDDPKPISADLPKDRINILLVTARPFEFDVKYRSISRPLVELIDKNNIPAHVHVLRPPTFENLLAHLKEHPRFYHIIHFDGHGGYGQTGSLGHDSHKYKASEGVLVFEDDKEKERPVTAEVLAALMREHAVPIIVLNACRSGMLDTHAKDPFASVAAALVKTGVRGVVAMAYSLYVSGAKKFIPAFYQELFATRDLSIATRAGRQAMLADSKRICARGEFELRDFVVPVIYQQEKYGLPFVKKKAKAVGKKKIDLPEDAQDTKNPYGFIGRDRDLLQLERYMRKDTPAVLISGMGGVGKTTLARGFVKWLADTEGMDGCLWQTLIGVRSAEHVINTVGAVIFGENFRLADMDQRIDALAGVLKENRIVWVWDNFEVVAGIPGTYIKPSLTAGDRQLLKTLLEKMRGGKGKVIITSRSEEDWLGIQRIKATIGGLVGEERWDLCEKIVGNLGIKINREDKDLVELMDQLQGHPLSMRAILPKLAEKMTARQIITALKSNVASLGLEADQHLYAILKFIEDGLPDDLKPLLIPLSLHEQYTTALMLEEMCKQVDKKLTRAKIDKLCNILTYGGLMWDIGQNIYWLHPAMTGYLRTTFVKTIAQKEYDAWCGAFVDVMGRLADALAPKELHEQRIPFLLHGANFHFALAEAVRLGMDTHQRAIIQSLAVYAQHTLDYDEAGRLYERLGELYKAAKNEEGEAVSYHQLGLIARKRRDFAAAEKWCHKSLAIKEKRGNEQGAAGTYVQLGMIAQEDWDFTAAEKWCHKAVNSFEKLGNEHDAAMGYWALGNIALEQRQFESAEKWYLKALPIYEKTTDDANLAGVFHQLGTIAEEQRDFAAAEKWYHKALAIDERQGNEDEAATTYHQLGIIAGERRDFAAARKWYHRAVNLFEKLGNEHHAAAGYHQLGIVAQEQRDFAAAEKWYHKALAINERQGNEDEAANTYHQLGRIAQERRDFAAAEGGYQKAVNLFEKLSNEHSAATAYGQLGNLAGSQGSFVESARWLAKSIRAFSNTNDEEGAIGNAGNFMIFYEKAPQADKAKMKKIWEEAGLGPFPAPPDKGKKKRGK